MGKYMGRIKRKPGESIFGGPIGGPKCIIPVSPRSTSNSPPKPESNASSEETNRRLTTSGLPKAADTEEKPVHSDG